MNYSTILYCLIASLLLLVSLSGAQKRLVLKHPRMRQNDRANVNELTEYEDDRFYDQIEDDAISGPLAKKRLIIKKYKKKG